MAGEQETCRQAETEFKLARFPADLRLPEGEKQQLQDAAAAVRQEYQDSSRWKRLSCRKVSVFAERDRGTVYVIHLGKSVRFDWTWEGARAFCPYSLQDDDRFADRFYEGADCEDEVVWSGEILEVDEQNGCLFIKLDDPEATPKDGPFLVSPFEFLSDLNGIYNTNAFEGASEQIRAMLNASEGDVHPLVAEPGDAGFEHLREWWKHSWSVLWGPPGTGKTWTTASKSHAS